MKMITYDPSERISSSAALAHPWFTAYTNETTPTSTHEAVLKSLQEFEPQRKFQ
jgi:serine/threonine protein kinase